MENHITLAYCRSFGNAHDSLTGIAYVDEGGQVLYLYVVPLVDPIGQQLTNMAAGRVQDTWEMMMSNQSSLSHDSCVCCHGLWSVA